MRPAVWYLSSMFVAILYIYLLAIQYVRGDIHQSGVDFGYHNYDQMTSMLRNFTTRYPDLSQLYSIGSSSQGWCNVDLLVDPSSRNISMLFLMKAIVC